ncbi:hypothetical protein FNF27_07563 [Cafeteria roenbergensis]|uniref:Serine/threonine-protein phosphatase 2A activator n=1 Tax=Cafeteria roenbergensis TaxID=33653 RepID=A0A5A8DKF5_CAFRO|nr:hypothetical protein FNF27_07563 [Cafeteria roenbergensis]
MAAPKSVPPPTVHHIALQRMVFGEVDHSRFVGSAAYNAVVAFVGLLRAAVRGEPRSVSAECPPPLQRLREALEEVMKWVDDFPPLDQPMRFGNQAFRQWHGRLLERAAPLVERVCGPGPLGGWAVKPGRTAEPTAARPAEGASAGAAAGATAAPAAAGDEQAPAGRAAEDEWASAVAAWEAASDALGAVPAERDPAGSWQRQELTEYLWDSFGNSTRVDYGTGHETTFVLLAMALARCGAWDASDRGAVRSLAVRVMPVYLSACRRLQRTYLLEPAGSHGVWSLDDFHILSFALGAAQLAGGGAGKAAWQLQNAGSLEGFVPGGRALAPRAFLDADVRSALRSEWLLAEAVAGVCESKHGAPFAEHSPRLHEVLQGKSWPSAESALFGTWVSEVLGKRPVVQGLLFGGAAAAQAAAGAEGGTARASGGAGRPGLWPAQWAPSGEALDRRREEQAAREAAIAGLGASTAAPWAKPKQARSTAPWASAATAAPWASASTAAPWATGAAARAPAAAKDDLA